MTGSRPSCAAVNGIALFLAAYANPAAPRSGGPPSSSALEVGFGHIRAVSLDPADGSVLAATHRGVSRIDPRGVTAQIGGPARDVTALTVTATDDAARLLGSGHQDDRGTETAALGLVASDSSARSWAPVSLGGQADFHALSAAGATVYDYGQHRQRGAQLAATGLDLDPDDPHRVLVATPDGLQESVDGGLTFRLVQPQPPQPLLLIDHITYRFGTDRSPMLAGLDCAGRVWSFGEAGWQASGTLAATPTAFTVIGPDRYLAATVQDVLRSEDAGRTWTILT